MKRRILILSVMLLSFAPPVFALGENTMDSTSMTGVACSANPVKTSGTAGGSQVPVSTGATSDAQLQ